MRNHRTKFYIDGHKKIEYCTICGREENELSIFDCLVDKESPDQQDFFQERR